jgi:hypothetical protein
MFRHTDDLQLSVEEKPKQLSYIITKWLNKWNHNLAFRLFQVAHTGNKIERRKAVQALSSLKDLKGN